MTELSSIPKTVMLGEHLSTADVKGLRSYFQRLLEDQLMPHSVFNGLSEHPINSQSDG